MGQIIQRAEKLAVLFEEISSLGTKRDKTHSWVVRPDRLQRKGTVSRKNLKSISFYETVPPPGLFKPNKIFPCR